MVCVLQRPCRAVLLCMQSFMQRFLRQYRTKSVWRLCTPSACKFPVIFHKNAREYSKYSLRFLFHLTKNLTTHLSHNLCAVLPLICCGANLFYEPQELCLSGIGAFENTCVQQNLFKDCPDFLLNDRFRIFRIGFGVACADFLQP